MFVCHFGRKKWDRGRENIGINYKTKERKRGIFFGWRTYRELNRIVISICGNNNNGNGSGNSKIESLLLFKGKESKIKSEWVKKRGKREI